ncbi:hypothetical protein EMCRGX_G012271 [Ephydatia muelleri]
MSKHMNYMYLIPDTIGTLEKCPIIETVGGARAWANGDCGWSQSLGQWGLWVESQLGPMGTVGGARAWANGDCGWRGGDQSLGQWGLWVEPELGPMGTVGGIRAWANGDCGWNHSLGQWGLWVEPEPGPMGTVGGITAWANGGTSLLKSLQQHSISMNDFQVLCGRSWVSADVAEKAAKSRKHENNDTKCSELGWQCLPRAVETYGAWGAVSYIAIQEAILTNFSKSQVFKPGRIIVVQANARAILARSLQVSADIYAINY